LVIVKVSAGVCVFISTINTEPGDRQKVAGEIESEFELEYCHCTTTI